MMRLLFITLFSVLAISPSLAQERVRNIRLRVVDSSQLEIRYDLITARPGDSVYFDLRSRLRGTLHVLPQFVRGDIGIRITAGPDRRIVWNALANGYSLNEEIQAIIRVKTGIIPDAAQLATNPASTTPSPEVIPEKPARTNPVVTADPPKTERPISTPDPQSTAKPSGTLNEPISQPDTVRFRKERYAGPAWALLSAVAPGIGNIFVQWPKPKIGLRPLITIGCYGLVAYGILEREKSMDNFAIYEQQKNTAAAEPYYTAANEHHHRYFLATRGALVVAAADVVLTFLKGLRNSQLKKEARRIQSFTVYPGLQAGQPTAVVRYSF
jgi:hypothetical protein